MSPIEVKLYEALVAEGLSPVPQYCIEGYFADFAFPDIRLAVEADGAAFHGGAAKSRDRKRDWILKNAGWTVKRFHGSTIHERAGNCAFVVKREVEAVRSVRAELAAAQGRRREARKQALLGPFRWLAGLFRPGAPTAPSAPPTRVAPPPRPR